MDLLSGALDGTRIAAVKWQKLIDNGASESEITAAKEHYLRLLDGYHAMLLGNGHCDIYKNIRK